MDVPITIGIFLALALSVYETQHHAPHAYFDSAIMLLAFLLAGRVMDQAMRRKTRAAAGNLAALKGENALRCADTQGWQGLKTIWSWSRWRRWSRATAFWCAPASAFPPTA